MKFIILLVVVACMAIIVQAQLESPESKYHEIIQLLSNNEQQLKAEAQTFTTSVVDPNSAFSHQGFSRATERSRYQPAQPQPTSSVSISDEEAKRLAEEEEDEKKPDRLALLLAESKFTCENLKNGYYADESVGCQVFHYCIDGVKHSWQCPENTVFHQIHLNCVPNTQDICQQSSKYHIVNEYLHKELDERGPNNTVLYHQRFYPDGFDYSGGDPVAQIFQAQAQAALQKAQQAAALRNRQPLPVEDDDEPEPVPPPRPRTRSRPQQQFNAITITQPQSQPQIHRPQSVPISNKPILRGQFNSRPSLVSSYTPSAQHAPSKPTNRPTLSFSSAPETFAPPTYTESPTDVFGSNEFSHSSSHSDSSPSLQSGFQPSTSTFNVPSSTSFQTPSSSSSFTSSGSSSGSSSSGFQPSTTSTSSFSPSSSTSSQSGGFRTIPTSSRSTSGYPTRSLGIPIASFRVAPAASFVPSSSPVSAQESAIEAVNVAPLFSFTSLSNNHDENRQLLSHLFF